MGKLQPCSILDLAGCSSSKAAAVMRTAKARIRDRLNLVNGAAVRFTYFSRGVDQPGTLLICIHQMLIDRCSWRILISDLQTAYRQIARGESIELSRQATSLISWGEWLQAQAQAS